MEKITLTSATSGVSKSNDIIIRESNNTRLILRPVVLDNENNDEACVKGSIIYQRKNSNGEYNEDDKAFSLNQVKKGQYCKIDLKSEEVLILLEKFNTLKELYKQHGFNFGERTYYITEENLGEIIDQLSKFEDKEKILNALKNIESEDLDRLSMIVSLSKIETILKEWEENKSNPDEEFWQNKFEENNWILSQIFACPYIYLKDKPYLGGKGISNTGGVCSDFLMKHPSSENIAFIEIKSPTKKLLKPSLYRGTNDSDENAIYSPSGELGGAINQVINQRDNFLEKKHSLGKFARDYRNPKCVLIIGKREELLEGQAKNFDLFRHNLQNVEILTFDELFERIKLLKEIFMVN